MANSLDAPTPGEARSNNVERLQQLEAERAQLARELEEQRALRAVMLAFHQPEATEASRTIELEHPSKASTLSLQIQQVSTLDHGGVLWQAGEELAKYLLQHRDTVLSQLGDRDALKVVELGAGVAALPAMAAAVALGGTVVATDVAPILPLMQANIQKNLPSLDLAPNTTITCEACEWGAQEPPDSPADLVIGADLIYDPAHHKSLVVAMRQALEGSFEGAFALLAHKERHLGAEESFFALLESSGFQQPKEIAALPASPGTSGRVCIVEVRLANPEDAAARVPPGDPQTPSGLYL